MLWPLSNISAQSETTDTTLRNHEKIKKGWNFGVLPAVAFDSDIGIQYGAIANVFHYGNGDIYPRYKHSIYMEWSRTTKGSGINQLKYDSEYLIPHIRVNFELSYITDQALYFYGFNGYEAYYNPDYENRSSPSYISKMYYRLDRKLTRLKFDFQGPIIERKFRWLLGYTYFNSKIGSVDIDKLNKGKSESDKLRDTTLLYDNLVTWGIIPANQKDGGATNFVKLGFIYDTRDNEPNPMRGIWTEAMLWAAPSFIDNHFSFAKLILTHRQYFTLKKEVLNFAYRLSYQAKVAGEIPFYMLPYIYNSTVIRDGLGGGKTIRGILRNRVVGDDMLYGNFEVRWKFLRMIKFNQNFYFAFTLFTDVGKVTGKYSFNGSGPEACEYLAKGSSETWHQGYGAGLYAAMNQNFVAALNYGMAANPKDGNAGLYIGLDFLF
jgi:outer membrane protein assembly factor BamA